MANGISGSAGNTGTGGGGGGAGGQPSSVMPRKLQPVFDDFSTGIHLDGQEDSTCCPRIVPPGITLVSIRAEIKPQLDWDNAAISLVTSKVPIDDKSWRSTGSLLTESKLTTSAGVKPGDMIAIRLAKRGKIHRLVQVVGKFQ